MNDNDRLNSETWPDWQTQTTDRTSPKHENWNIWDMGEEGFFKAMGDHVLNAVPKQNAVDGAIERFNRRTISTFFLIFSIIATTEHLVGHPIKCTEFSNFVKKGGSPNDDFAEDYCWTQGLFTNRYAYNLPRQTLPAPGIIPCVRYNLLMRYLNPVRGNA